MDPVLHRLQYNREITANTCSCRPDTEILFPDKDDAYRPNLLIRNIGWTQDPVPDGNYVVTKTT